MPRLVLSASGQAGSTFGAEMQSSGNTYILGSAPVWQVDGKIGYALTQSFELTTEARFDGFGYAQSSTISNSLEPESYTHQLSVLAGLAYHL